MPETTSSTPVAESKAATATGLSRALKTVWAKAPWDPHDPDKRTMWLPLTQHALDTFSVAERLWVEWAPRSLRVLLAEPLDGDQDAARSLFLFLAGVHDVGKASPAFAVQVPELTGPMWDEGLRISNRIAGTQERSLARHELVSFDSVKEWLRGSFGLTASASREFASVVGIHHGTAVRHSQLPLLENPALVGDGAWTAVRTELIEWIGTMADLNAHSKVLREASFGAQRLVLLSALVVIADWIASNDRYFTLCPIGVQPTFDQDKRVRTAWASLGLPQPWQAVTTQSTVEGIFRERFGFEPRPVQREFAQIAAELTEPALLILEAPMGSGKTEAALVAAELRAAATDASGLFIALPTQATSDGMFGRTLRWARNLPGNAPTVFLAHGKREQNKEFEALLFAAHHGAIAQDDEEAHGKDGHRKAHDAVVHAWLADRRRGPLSALVVGTVDQVLMASLRSRYAQLRHLALANKIVVIDEAHAYSAFMNVYLDRTLHWLGAYGTTVIILSATLPNQRRQELVDAYESGRREAATGRPSGKGVPAAADESLVGETVGYPSIVVSRSAGAPLVVSLPNDGASAPVEIVRIRDSWDAIGDELTTALRNGGCAAVVLNTVTRVQRAATALRRRFPDDIVIVAHAGFLAADRAAKDRELLRLFGPPASTGSTRPHRAIVVGTQVIEQSLDIDFDVMVTDLAPMDLLLQRSGRLHRHQRDDRPLAVAHPRLLLTGVDWSTSPPTPNGMYTKVYSPYVLLRTLHALKDRSTVTVPDDISPLVQTVYGADAIDDPAWAEPVASAKRQHDTDRSRRIENAEQFQLGTVADEPDLIQWNTGGADDPDTRGAMAVRDGGDSLEVLAIWRAGGSLFLPEWLPHHGGELLPDLEAPAPKLIRALLSCSLRLPYQLCVPATIDSHIAELEKEHPAQAWRHSPALKRELVLVFDQDGRATLGEHRLRYSRESGLEIVGDD